MDFSKRLLHVRRNYTSGALGMPKSGKVRSVPLIDQAARVLDALSRREHFTADDDLVFGNVVGRLHRRVGAAAATTGRSTGPG